MCRYVLIYICLTCLVVSCSSIDDQYIEDSVTTTQDQDKIETNVAQNEWIYEKMTLNYYWNYEMPDSLSLDFSAEATTFFPLLLSTSDRFSWIEVNDSYTKSGSYETLGIKWQEYVGCSGETLCRTLQVAQNSVASNYGIKRGDWFVKNADDDNILNITLGSLDDQYSFVSERNISIYANTKTEQETSYSVSLDSVYTYDDHKIGYFVYDSFEDTSGVVSNPYRTELRELMTEFKNAGVDDLIVDLRYNSGGYISICIYLSTLMLSDEYLGTTYGFNEYNAIISQEYLESTGQAEEQLYFFETDDVLGTNLGMQKIYVILTGDSYSASEAFTNALSPIMEVIHVGTSSGGKGVGSYSIADSRYEYQLQPITFRYYNRDHQTVADSGLTPTIYADESLEEVIYDLGDTRELLLSAAIDDILGLGNTKSSSSNDVGTIPFTPISTSSDIKGYIY